MIARPALLLILLGLATSARAQSVRVATGEVVRTSRPDDSRLSTRIPGVDLQQRDNVHVSGDSAQRIAMADYGWRGRVLSVEVDEDDARVFWDVKIVPDSSRDTVVRYRVDAGNGGILGVREFTGIHIRVHKP
jgi:uncharacterized membrane protein YkoI